MKLLLPFALAATAVALVLPDSETFLHSVKSTFGTGPDSIPSDLPPREYFDILGQAVGDTADWIEDAEVLDDLVPVEVLGDALEHSLFTKVDELEIAHDDPDHHHPDLTIYQLISKSNHTTIFAKHLAEFDDLVEKLNGTSDAYTVLVPIDSAFKRFKKHRPTLPKEYLRQFLEYHISPKSRPVKELFASRTIPTLLEQDELGYPQRISTQLGLRGISFNFLAHLVKRDIEAKNGIIHGIDHFLVPPFLASDTLNFLSPTFGTFEFGLAKTGLFEEISKTSTHTGATIFAPTNLAFRRLPPPVAGFLFSRWGEKYLKALLKYHIVFDHTLYSDAYNKPKDDKESKANTHVDLPTLLDDQYLSIDIAHIGRFFTIKINGFAKVAVSDVVTKDGVIQIVNSILIPPRKGGKNVDDLTNLTVDELKERLDPFV